MKICKRCRVTGQVQGVFFRASTQSEARSLGLTGWAKNLPDGAVEVVACGEEPAVRALTDWLWEGPRHARVEAVSCEERAYEPLGDFSTR